MASLGDMTVRIGVDTTALRQGLDKVRDTLRNASTNLSKIGQGMQSFGKTLTTNVTLPLAGLGFAAVSVAAEFEAKMSQVQAISGATGEDLTMLSDKAKEMGSKTKFSATESAEAFKFMALAGYDTSKMLGSIEGVMSLAAASGEDLALVSDIVTDSMTAFGLSASETGRFADVLAATSSNANTNIAMLGESFKYVAPVAGSLGFSVEDTSLALGIMANAGIKASQSGTNLRAIFTRLVKPTKESQEAIDKLGLQVQNADGTLRPLRDILSDLRVKFADLTDAEKTNTAGKLAGQIAMSGLLTLVGAGESDFNKLSDAINNSEGVALKMAKTMQGNLMGQLTELKSALEGVAIQLGEILIPIISDLVKKYIKPLVDWFASLSTETKKTILIVGGIVAVIGPVIAILGTMISGISAFIGAIAAISAPVWGWIAAIVAVGGALAVLWKENEQFRDTVKQIWGNIWGYLSEVFTKIKEYAMVVWGEMKDFWAQNGQEITATLMEIWNSIYAFMSTYFEGLKLLFIAFIDGAIFVWQNFGSEILGTITNVFTTIGGVISGALDVITGIWNVFIGLFTGDWNRMWEGLKGVVVGVFDAITSLFEGLFEQVGIFMDLYDKIMGNEGEIGFTSPNQGISVVDQIKRGEYTPPTLNTSSGSAFGDITPDMITDDYIRGLTNPNGPTINITGNNINDSMDVDIIADKMANKLKFAGVY